MVLGFFLLLLNGSGGGMGEEILPLLAPDSAFTFWEPESFQPPSHFPEGRDSPFPLDEVTLRFQPGVDPDRRKQVLERIQGRILRQSRNGDYICAKLPREDSLLQALSVLQGEPAVVFAEPHFIVNFQPRSPLYRETLDDPLLSRQWVIENPGGQACFVKGVDIDLAAAWEITCGSKDVVVVVIDSGVDLDHPDLEAQIYPRGDEDWNFSLDASKIPEDSTGHGTAVAGLAAAAAGNGVGIAGVAPGCRLIPLKVDGLDMVMNFVDALDYLVDFAARHSQLRLVVNGSLKITDSLAVHDAVIRARRAGIILCFSSGNDGGPVDFPAAYSQAIAVGAIGPDGFRKQAKSCLDGRWSSAHGPELDLVAPGVQLATTDKVGPSGLVSGDFNLEFGGTSAACPIVAGVVALMLSANPQLTPDRVQGILIETAVDLEGDPEEDKPGFDEYMGWGRIDAGRAVAQAAAEVNLKKGDVDCGGSADLEDVLRILGFLFTGQEKPTCFVAAADANGDGEIDVSDPIYLIRWLFLGGPPPP